MSELKIVHIEVVTTGKAILKCAYCGGTGGVPRDYKPEYQKVCPVCGGTGKVLVEFEQEPFVECAYCGGTGGVPKDYKPEYQKVCPVCKGVGAKPITGSWRILK